jgi:hypothetical protein
MWMNLADLIHNRVADRKGNILPVDVNTVTYDLQNSTPRSYGLMANVLSIDSTLDSRVRSGYANCCSTINPGWDPSAVILGFGTNVTYGLDATDSCNGDQDDLLPDSSDWASADPSIAKVTKGEVAAVTAGSTTGSADVFVVQGVGGYCAGQLLPVTAPITVTPTISSISPAQGLVGVGIGVTITGTGFASGAAVNAGSNVSVSSISVASSTQITATFTPTNSSSAGGNQAVTVSVPGSQPSNSKNFLNQVPTHFQRYDQPPEAPGGIGPVITLADGTAYNLSGKVMALNACGVYENFIFDIADQQNTQITNGNVTVTEVFSNVSSPPGPTPATINLVSQGMQDFQIYAFTYPTCPANNQHQTLDMSWTVQVGSSSILQPRSFTSPKGTSTGL